MRKNIFSVLVMLLALCCFIGCDNPAAPNSGNDGKDDINGGNEEVAATGWYEFIRDVTAKYPEDSSVIIYVNEKGKVTRAGNKNWEYDGDTLDYFLDTYKNFSTSDIREDYFKIIEEPKWNYLKIQNGEKILAGWYYENSEKIYLYINSKGSIGFQGDNNARETPDYDIFSESICTKTQDGFEIEIQTDSELIVLYFSRVNLAETPTWCKDLTETWLLNIE